MMKPFEMPNAHQRDTVSSMISDVCVLLTPLIVVLIGVLLWDELAPSP